MVTRGALDEFEGGSELSDGGVLEAEASEELLDDEVSREDEGFESSA
jgi:hypothetical protein